MKKPRLNAIIAVTVAGFILAILLVAADEIFDIPYHLFNALPTPINWTEIIIEAIFILIVGSLTIFMLRTLHSRGRMAEEARGTSEARFRSTLDGMLEGCQIIGFDWRYLYLNDAADKHNRRPKEELLGNKYMDMWPGIEATEVFAVLRRGMEERLPQSMENEFTFPDGSKGWFELSIEPVPQGVFILSLDITERKRMEELSRSLFMNSPVGIYITQRGKFCDVNPQFQKDAGYSENELVGMDSMNLVMPEDRETVRRNAIQMLKGGNTSPYEFRVIGKDGGINWASETVAPIQYKGAKAVVGIFRNITERKRAQEELQKHREHLEELVTERTTELEEKTIELQQANIHLQEMDRLKSVFLASMSHELRTPLNSIIGFTGIILKGMSGEVNEEQQKQLTMVKNSANHLLSLINDVLDVSKIEAGKVELSLEEFSFEDVVREVVEPLLPAASGRGLELNMRVPEGIMLFSDKRRIKQVLMNLMSNAIKFTDRGSVKIEAAVPGDNNLEIRVSDTGIGIRKEEMGKLFQPFQQVDISLVKKREGTGLGLYLTKKLVILLGGDISAKSEYGKGSEFTFIVPLCHEEANRK